jgi:hypothetical protein
VDSELLRRHLDDVFDHSLVFHGFTPYMRDYQAIVHVTADPVTGIAPQYLRYLFRHCVEVSVQSTVPPEIWQRSLDERLIRYETGVDLEGYVWGVNGQELYPGMTEVADSERARQWAESIGIDFHEVRIEGNAHAVTLVFSDLVVSELEPGYVPFVTG